MDAKISTEEDMDKVYCEECKHCQPPYSPNLFSQRQLNKTAGLEASLKREERETQRRRMEQQIFDERKDFAWKPHNYFWCDAMTPCKKGLMRDLNFLISNKKVEQAQNLREQAANESKKLSDLISKAEKGDRAAKRKLSEYGFYNSAREVIKLYAISEIVNKDYQCPLFEKQHNIEQEGDI